MRDLIDKLTIKTPQTPRLNTAPVKEICPLQESFKKTLDEMSESMPKIEGRKSAEKGLLFQDNPYSKDDPNHHEWKMGWISYKDEDVSSRLTEDEEIGVWKPWSGTDTPPKNWKVAIRRRDGEERRGWSEVYDWTHKSYAYDGNEEEPTDIVEYMLLHPREISENLKMDTKNRFLRAFDNYKKLKYEIAVERAMDDARLSPEERHTIKKELPDLIRESFSGDVKKIADEIESSLKESSYSESAKARQYRRGHEDAQRGNAFGHSDEHLSFSPEDRPAAKRDYRRGWEICRAKMLKETNNKS